MSDFSFSFFRLLCAAVDPNEDTGNHKAGVPCALISAGNDMVANQTEIKIFAPIRRRKWKSRPLLFGNRMADFCILREY